MDKQMIEAVKQFCCRPENYENGWDIVVECYTDAQIKDAIGNARTLKAALKNVDKKIGVRLYHEIQSDIRGA